MYTRILVSVAGLCTSLGAAAAVPEVALREVQNIALPTVSGAIDHLAVDVTGEKLFVAASADHSVEAVDLKAGQVAARLTGLKQPRRVALLPLTAEIRGMALLSSTSGVPQWPALIVTNGADLHAEVYDGLTLRPLKQIEVEQHQGDIQVDPRVARTYIGGESNGAGVLAVIDEFYVKVAEIHLSARPASFRLDSNGERIFVNLPSVGTVAVVDRLQNQVVASWPLAGQGNFAVALDELHHRLFVATREPAKLLVLDTRTGQTVAALDCVGEAEDIFYAADRGLVYVSGAEGFIDVFRQIDSDRYELVQKVPTAKGARASLYVSQWHRLFVAMPSRPGTAPRIRIYEAEGL
ncbi:MAG TPA: hypothetical protein VFB54_13130 [Burkholderiales bacterium]|nr:hypothetical protein [Burkholderiales bacterium]